MLETIGAYGLDRLRAAGELDATRQRHARYYLAYAEAIDRRVWTPEHRAWMDRLEATVGNLRAALGRAAERGEVDVGLRLGAALWLFWQTRGRVSEGRRWLDAALTRDGGLPWERAAALLVAGMLAWLQRDDTRAGALLAESLTCWRAIGFPQGIARALSGLAVVAVRAGDVAAAAL